MKNIQSAPTTAGRLRRHLTTALLMLSLTVGTIATTATPAEAASTVSGCFTPYWSGMTLVTMPVKLQASANPYDLRRYPWVDVSATTIFGNGNGGCVQFYINDPSWRAFLYFRLVIDYPYYTGHYTSISPLMARPGQGPVFVGNAVITCSGSCSFGR